MEWCQQESIEKMKVNKKYRERRMKCYLFEIWVCVCVWYFKNTSINDFKWYKVSCLSTDKFFVFSISTTLSL